MGEIDELRSEVATETERSAEEIKQNILAKQEDLSESVAEIGERIKEKLDWREYVGQAPFLAIGVAAGIGFLASGILPRRPTAIERIAGAIGEEAGHVVSGLVRGPAKSAFKLGLWSIASTMALSLAKKAAYEAILGKAYGSSQRRTPKRI